MTTTGAPGGDDGGAGDGPGGWQPLAGAALLDRIRITGLARPSADPDLVADLRAYLERGLADSPAGSGAPAPSGSPVLVVTRHRIARALACPVHRDGGPGGERVFTLPLACGALVAVLFRQLVAAGTIGAAWDEAIQGLAMDDHHVPLVRWIGELPEPARAELRGEVERQADGLRRRWPALDPTWLPRTEEPLRVPLAGGRCLLSARIDLVLGHPARDVATVALVEVTSGARWAGHAADRHFDALVETLRTGVPPFAVATYSTRTGELDVDPVTPELLVGATRRCLAGARAMAAGDAGATATDTRHCVACASGLVPVRPTLVEVPPPAPGALSSPAVSSPAVSSPAVSSPAVSSAAAAATEGAGGPLRGTGGSVVGFPGERAA